MHLSPCRNSQMEGVNVVLEGIRCGGGKLTAHFLYFVENLLKKTARVYFGFSRKALTALGEARTGFLEQLR